MKTKTHGAAPKKPNGAIPEGEKDQHQAATGPSEREKQGKDANVGTSKEAFSASGDRVALTYFTDENGKIAWDRMRSGTKDQFRKLLTDPDVIRNLGIPQEAQAEIPEYISPDFAVKIYDLLGPFEAFLAQKFFNVPGPVAARVFTYSDPEKKLLAEPTAKVVNKYATEWMIKYKEEIGLIIVFLGITTAKINMMKAMAALEKMQPQQTNDPPMAGAAAETKQKVQ